MKKDEVNSQIPVTNTEMVEYVKIKSITLRVFFILLVVFIIIMLAVTGAIYLSFKNKDTISKGVHIKGIDVSGLTKDEAIDKVKSHLDEIMNETISLDYNNKQYYVEVEQIEAMFDIESAVDSALSIGRQGKVFSDISSYLVSNIGGIDIDPTLIYNNEALDTYIDDIQSRLPDQLEQYSYYIEDGHLIITSGKYGAVIYKDQLKDHILETIQDISYNDKVLSIPTYKVYPDKIDVQKIHDEVYAEVKDASFTREPYAVYPSVIGVDFDVATVQQFIEQNPKNEEYDVQLSLTYPRVTVNDLGYDPFPHVLSTFSTSYYTSNADRTTNLRLAASKINGTVVMPGETFSYNKVVGKRTVAAGYKEAAIYQNGQVTDGLGGGICQISSTLYNAAVAADMEIMQRRNHQFVPSYVKAGYDATVVWGSTDFQFLNRRNYPVKIEASVSGGIARITIHGLKNPNEPTCAIETVMIKNTSKSIVVDSYRVYRQNGVEVKRSKMYRDTYLKH